MGHLATDSGRVITVNATASPDALFNSLSPSNLCPNFVDGNGGDYSKSDPIRNNLESSNLGSYRLDGPIG